MSVEHESSGELVIVVDRDRLSLQSVGHVLAELGFRVLELPTAATALPIVQSRRADVVITEHFLDEEIDGSVLCARARDAWGASRPALIGMTRFPARIPTEARGGYDAIIAKPVGVKDLLETVDRALELRNEPAAVRVARR